MTFYKSLIPFDIFATDEPISIDLPYQNADHHRNIFKEAIYRRDARCWVHKDLAAITLLTARLLSKRYDWSLQIKDCLRTSDSQTAMIETDVSKANPHWFEEPRLLSPPGAGAHPRAMAIDVCALYSDSSQVNMGTPFDWMDEKSARNYNDFPDEILENRKKLEEAYLQSAEYLKQNIIPLPEEWWDFRFGGDIYEQYAPLSDADIPPQMQMTNEIDNNIDDLPLSHFEKLAEEIRSLIHKADENI
ncbi:MAG: M15 family metallopeptidase [Pseudomonadota bacterium]